MKRKKEKEKTIDFGGFYGVITKIKYSSFLPVA